MSSNGHGPCLIEHCPNNRRLRSPVCQACAQNFRYWDTRGASAIMQRQSQLEKWQDRMEYLGEHTSNRRIGLATRHVEKRRA
ncbi:MAG: hypothetical protein HRJ53_07560 [Acidobacteria bacterium Pan2503]|uniref:Uncharacterized protein n=1 Tax=Candidatus Acidiferrum panamense TaxID=2741543 RepID=A0A7V8NPJ0_9BACT|nr:hypothetical protein [Candidatus Acidoferrum panamensis]